MADVVVVGGMDGLPALLMWIWYGLNGFLTISGPVTWLEVVGDGVSAELNGEWFGGALALAADLGHDLYVSRGRRPEAID